MCYILKDIGLSKDLNEIFKVHLAEMPRQLPLDIDFNIQVLSSGSWPFQQSFNFSLPTEVCNFDILCYYVVIVMFSLV